MRNWKEPLLIIAMLIGLLIGCSLTSCEQEQPPAPVQPQTNIVEIIIVGDNDSAYVNGNLDGGFYYYTDSTYNEYDFAVNPSSASYSVSAQYINAPSDSISIYVLINSSQVATAHGVGFASCLFVY